MHLEERVMKVMFAKQILTNPPKKTFETRFPDPAILKYQLSIATYTFLSALTLGPSWLHLKARPLETEGKDMHSQDLVPSTAFEQWRVNWDGTFDNKSETQFIPTLWMLWTPQNVLQFPAIQEPCPNHWCACYASRANTEEAIFRRQLRATWKFIH